MKKTLKKIDCVFDIIYICNTKRKMSINELKYENGEEQECLASDCCKIAVLDMCPNHQYPVCPDCFAVAAVKQEKLRIEWLEILEKGEFSKEELRAREMRREMMRE